MKQSGSMVFRAAVRLAAAIGVVLSAGAALAQGDSSRNAAAWYQRAFAELERFTPEEMELIEAYRSGGGVAPSPEVRALINRAAPIIDNALRASSQGYSDFGLDYSQGFDMLLPHLGKMRSIARLMQADSMMRLGDGDGAGAAERIAAMYRLADHTGDDHILISSLVSRAIFEVADTSAQMGFDHGAFDPATAMVLLRSTQNFDQRDPFQMLESIMMEQTLAVNMIRDHFMGDDPQKRSAILEGLAREGGLDDEFAALSRESLETELDRYSALMNRYAEIWAGDDPEVVRSQIKQLEGELENGVHGLMAQLLMPALGRAYDLGLQSRERLHDRIELLEGITKGQVDVQTLTNAAVWYRRGIERLDSLDQSWKEALAAVDPSRPLSTEEIERLTLSIAGAQTAISDFVEGSNIRRCDFAIGRSALEVFIPTYADGMRDAFRLVSLESMRLAAQGDQAGAARLLGVGFRMAAHLSDDALIVSSLVTRDGFLLLSATAAGIETRHRFDEPSRQDLAAAIRRNGTSDPFGYVEASMKTREHLEKSLVQWGEVKDRAEREARLGPWLKTLDADELVYLLAMLDVINFDLTPRDPFNRPDAGRLSEYLLAETMDLAAIDAPAFAELLRAGRAEAFEVPETAQIIGAAARMSSARRDQWATISWAQEREGGEEESGAAGDE